MEAGRPRVSLEGRYFTSAEKNFSTGPAGGLGLGRQ
jgi:hypothetical protein